MSFKKKFLSLAICTMMSIPAATEESDRSMSLSISPLAIIIGSADLVYQLKLLSFMSLTVPVAFTYFWPIEALVGMLGNKENTVTFSKAPIIINGGVGARFTPFSQVMSDSFFLEPRLLLAYSQIEADIKNVGKFGGPSTRLIPKLMLGWDWFYDSGFLVSFGGGIGYAVNLSNEFKFPSAQAIGDALKIASSALPNALIPSDKGNFVWELDFKLGYAW